VSEYRLYRSVNSEPFNLLPIYVWDRVNQPNKELKYIDVVTSFGDGNGRFCYYIEAVEGIATPYGPVLEGSLSNIACVSQTPIIFVPNTFTPNGDEHNEVFRPVTYFVSEEGYSFSIYNRAGEKIFETDSPQKGWDGSYKGAQVQNGNYVYHLQFLNDLGNLTEKTDVINLVR
jgi:gliding motility-associated-like protein